MKQKYLPKIDRGLLLVTLLLIIFGLLAVFSASSVLSFQRFGHNYYYFTRQAVWVAIGLLTIWLVSRIHYRVWEKWSKPIMLTALLLLILVLVPGVGRQFGGSRSWIDIGPVTFQPAEFVKLAIIFYLASWFERKQAAESNFWFGVLPPLLVASLALILTVLQPDLGTALMFFVIALVIFFVAEVRLKYLVGLLSAGAVALVALVKAAPYRVARLTSFFDPSQDPLGIGYHINQALLAIGSGGFWGLGYAASRQKHNYLPEPISDSIFAVMAEEMGFVRISLVIILFAALVVLGLRLADRAPDRFARLTVAGIVGWIGLQAIINIGAISNILPLTGLTLPFVSYGGSSFLALSVAVGVMLNISKFRKT